MCHRSGVCPASFLFLSDQRGKFEQGGAATTSEPQIIPAVTESPGVPSFVWGFALGARLLLPLLMPEPFLNPPKRELMTGKKKKNRLYWALAVCSWELSRSFQLCVWRGLHDNTGFSTETAHSAAFSSCSVSTRGRGILWCPVWYTWARSETLNNRQGPSPGVISGTESFCASEGLEFVSRIGVLALHAI